MRRKQKYLKFDLREKKRKAKERMGKIYRKYTKRERNGNGTGYVTV